MLHSVADRRRVKGGETEGKKGGGDSISFSPFREANGGGSEQGRKPSSSLACSSASPLFFLPRQRCSSAPRERRKKPSVDVPAVSKRAVLAAGRGEARPQSSGKFEPFFRLFRSKSGDSRTGFHFPSSPSSFVSLPFPSLFLSLSSLSSFLLSQYGRPRRRGQGERLREHCTQLQLLALFER